MMRSVKFLFFIILQLYTITLFLYTTHGVYKSYVEFFCKHRRPDAPDYKEQIYTGYVNVTKFDGYSDYILSYYNNKTHKLSKIGSFNVNYRNNETDPGEVIKYPLYDSAIYIGPLSWTYVRGESYFALTCKPSNGTFTSFNIAWKDFTYNVSGKYLYDNPALNHYRSEMSPLESNDLGYLHRSYNEIYYVQSNLNLSKIRQQDNFHNGFMCELEKSPYTCSFKQEVTNRFFVLYLATLILLVFANFLMVVKYKRFVFKRMVLELIKFVSSNTHEIKFCNPLTGDAFHFNKGDELTVLDECLSDLNVGQKMEYLKDREGEYFFTEGSTLIIKCNDLKGAFQCDDSARILIQRYFFMVYMEPNKCVCTEDLNHFMKTHEVLLNILNGCGIKFVKANCSGYVLDVHEYEFELVKKLFDIKNSTLKILLEHNWRFFGNKYNLPALINCLRDKVMFYNRPKDVKNSQWKMYLSDYSRFIKKIKDSHIKTIHLYAPTKHFIDLEDVDSADIDIITIKPVEIKMNKTCIEDKMDPVVKDAILQEIGNIKHYSCRSVPISSEIDLFEYDDIKKDIIGDEEEGENKKEKNGKVSYKDVLERYQRKAVEYLHVFPKEFKKINDFVESRLEMDPEFARFKNHYESEIINLEGTIRRLKEKNEVKGNFNDLLSKQNRILSRKKQALHDLVESKKGSKGKLKFDDARYVEDVKIKLKRNLIKIVCYDDLLKALEEYEESLNSKSDSESFCVTKKDIMDYCFRPKKVPGQFKGKNPKKKKQNNKSKRKSERLIATFRVGSLPKNKYISSNFHKASECALTLLNTKNAIVAKDTQQAKILPNKVFIDNWPKDLKCKEIYTIYKMYEKLSDVGYKKLCNPSGVELKRYQIEEMFSKPHHELLLRVDRMKSKGDYKEHILYDKLKYILPDDSLIRELIEIIS